MSLRLLVDEDLQAKILIGFLREDGHDVLTAREAGLESLVDDAVIAAAVATDRLLVTRDAADFRLLHQAHPDPPGILAVYQGADCSGNLTYREIAEAIHTLQLHAASTGWRLRGEFVVLNAWVRRTTS